MKLKFWQGEFEFDRDDAVIVIPLSFCCSALRHHMPKVWLLVGFAAYYVVLTLAWKLTEPLKKSFKWLHTLWVLSLSILKSREIFLQGYQGSILTSSMGIGCATLR